MSKKSSKTSPIKDIFLQEIEETRAQSFATRRACVPELEQVLYQPFPVLDKGFIRVIDYMGDDSAIVQAARVSYGKGTKNSRNDRSLIRYLMRHQHTTPFEMCEIKLHIKLPVFVARQWIRHRMASINEYSARYSILEDEFYIPDMEQLASQSAQNHQGRGEVLPKDEAQDVLDTLGNDAERCYKSYEKLLNLTQDGQVINPNRKGLARELARINLPVNVYTQWYWKVDLHNLFRFLHLRADSHAQYEIRAYAEAILNVVKLWVPMAYEAYTDYRQGSFELSGRMIEAVKLLIKGEKVDHDSLGLSRREWDELTQKLGIHSS